MSRLEIIKEIILENRSEVMRHHVIPRNVKLNAFDRQVLVGVRRAGKSYILYGRIQELIHAVTFASVSEVNQIPRAWKKAGNPSLIVCII